MCKGIQKVGQGPRERAFSTGHSVLRAHGCGRQGAIKWGLVQKESSGARLERWG